MLGRIILRFLVVAVLAFSLTHFVLAIAGATDLPAGTGMEATLVGLGEWVIALAVASLDLRREWRRLYAPLIPTCANCGYDLRGAASDRCPECGHPIAPGYLDAFEE
ncbi:MAG: hypothetical protein KDA33_04755 [Phycisphaerales bacterium]|nr:hypothetical protein [Phycisphaerales bacterium]